ncbi:hypothetical protein [Parasphingorhabdus pacifica]
MRVRRFAVAAASAGALLVAMAPAAFADHIGDRCSTPDCAGSASFVKNGDHLYVWDNKADGHSAVAEYTRSDVGQFNRAWNYSGNNTRIDHNMNMPENGTIRYRVCIGEYSSNADERYVIDGSCSDWKEERAS